MMQFLAVRSGLLAGGGSTDKTSSPAPASLPEFSATARASSSTNCPRLVFSRNALGFIHDKRCALTRWFVSGVSGQCRLTTSLCRKRDSRSTCLTHSILLAGAPNNTNQHSTATDSLDRLPNEVRRVE